EGYASDFILVDVDSVSKIDKNKFYSMGKNTPFDGISCTGFIQKTFVNGICVYDQKEESLR
ncbi:MAG: dihydroorotase, partial [Clostridium sp.]